MLYQRHRNILIRQARKKLQRNLREPPSIVGGCVILVLYSLSTNQICVDIPCLNIQYLTSTSILNLIIIMPSKKNRVAKLMIVTSSMLYLVSPFEITLWMTLKLNWNSTSFVFFLSLFYILRVYKGSQLFVLNNIPPGRIHIQHNDGRHNKIWESLDSF